MQEILKKDLLVKEAGHISKRNKKTHIILTSSSPINIQYRCYLFKTRSTVQNSRKEVINISNGLKSFDLV